MTITTLRPNADGTPDQWVATPGPDAFSAIDDDPDAPDDADFIEESVTGDITQVALTDKPADYSSSNSLTLRVRGRSSVDRGAVVELRKADETVLATVTFVTGVDTALVLKTATFNGNLTPAEVDGLKVEHRVTV